MIRPVCGCNVSPRGLAGSFMTVQKDLNRSGDPAAQRVMTATKMAAAMKIASAMPSIHVFVLESIGFFARRDGGAFARCDETPAASIATSSAPSPSVVAACLRRALAAVASARAAAFCSFAVRSAAGGRAYFVFAFCLLFWASSRALRRAFFASAFTRRRSRSALARPSRAFFAAA